MAARVGIGRKLVLKETESMKLFTVLLLTAVALSAAAQDKPRVFVQGKGSQNVSSDGSGGGGKHWGVWSAKSTIDAHDESMEVTKDLQKNCGGVMITINQANADYVVMLNRESKQNRGLLRSNSQLEVANKAGDVIGTNATHTVGNAAKDACNLIVADWQAHGKLNAEAPATPQPPVQATVQPAVQASPAVQTVPAAQVVPASAAATQMQPTAVPATVTISGSEAAYRQKQHQACLELAKDNPSIVCK
jgi:hypothetical protein